MGYIISTIEMFLLSHACLLGLDLFGLRLLVLSNSHPALALYLVLYKNQDPVPLDSFQPPRTLLVEAVNTSVMVMSVYPTQSIAWNCTRNIAFRSASSAAPSAKSLLESAFRADLGAELSAVLRADL